MSEFHRPTLGATLGTGLLLLLAPYVAAQETEEAASFAAPKRIAAGDAYLGEGRLYPSPAAHDVDGDGQVDLVIGDLGGRVTYALRRLEGDQVAFGPEQEMKRSDGKPLRFHNW